MQLQEIVQETVKPELWRTKFLTLLFLALSWTAVNASGGFDFFYFVQQWPGAYCDTAQKCCYPTLGKPAPAFSIHGLWPNYNDVSYPSNCGGQPFQANIVAEIRQQMDENWGSLSCPSSNSNAFWSHEWSKHGTCSGLPLHQYFQASLDLNNQYDITRALADAGIVPDNSDYDIQDIKAAMASILGFTPSIECNKDVQGKKQLYQVYICVSPDAATLIECPTTIPTECSGLVTFPRF